jgi:hypothetical protein
MPRKKFATHIANAKSFYDAVRTNCSETVLPNFYAVSGVNIANIYSDRDFARSDEEYYSNLELGLQLQNSALNLISKDDRPENWGISQHNIGHSYTKFFRMHEDKSLAMGIIDKAIYHLELSFQVRDWVEALQYRVASCRSLGEALIDRSMCVARDQAHSDLHRSYSILSEAASKISKIEHPNQWAEIQVQLARCLEQRLHIDRLNEPPEVA